MNDKRVSNLFLVVGRGVDLAAEPADSNKATGQVDKSG